MLQKNFDFEQGFEFTVEVNPGDVNLEKMSAYQKAGVNRVSLGVQAFQEHLLKDMNRPHGTHEVEQTVQMLRQSGLNNISMDIILNLPGQTLGDVQETLKRIIALEPNQVSVYDLDVHEKTAYGLRRREGRLKLANEEQHAQMADVVAHELESAGLIHYELTNFAREGFESRHNLIYWNNQPYLGLGPGAFSYLNQVRYQFALSVENYLKKVAAQDWKNEVEDTLTVEEIEKETFLTGIRLRQGIDLKRIPGLRSKIQAHAKTLIEEGLLEEAGEHLRFSERGKLVADLIFASFAQPL